MGKEISTNRLIIVILIAIALSMFSVVLSITRSSITAASLSGEGYVNLTVSAVTDVSIGIDSVEFLATSPGQSRNSYNSSDVKECGADNHCGFNMTNDGTTFINITIQETSDLFKGSSYDAEQHFTYNVTMQDPFYTTAYGSKGDCSTGYSQGLKGPDDGGQTGQWRAVPRDSAEVAVCYLNYTDYSGDGYRWDTARIELNITVPDDETTGAKTGILTFTAVATN